MSHQTISFIKSVIRLVGYIALPISLGFAAWILIISEIVGIFEEVGEE